MNNDIFISIMICCYNSEKYLNQTIDSIINQTYSNWEIIVINDGSTDSTEEIIFDYIDKGYPITYSKQHNKGFGSARNKAMELAKGDWIAIIDHDDICLPNRLELQCLDIINNPNAKLFFGNSIHINDKGKFLRYHFDLINPSTYNLEKNKAEKNLLRYGCFIDSETVVFNKNMAKQIGGFNETYKYILDFDFFLRVAKKHLLYCNTNPLSKWRIHSEQATQTMGTVVLNETIDLYIYYLKQSRINFTIKILLFLKILFYQCKKIINVIN